MRFYSPREDVLGGKTLRISWLMIGATNTLLRQSVSKTNLIFWFYKESEERLVFSVWTKNKVPRNERCYYSLNFNRSHRDHSRNLFFWGGRRFKILWVPVLASLLAENRKSWTNCNAATWQLLVSFLRIFLIFSRSSFCCLCISESQNSNRCCGPGSKRIFSYNSRNWLVQFVVLSWIPLRDCKTFHLSLLLFLWWL